MLHLLSLPSSFFLSPFSFPFLLQMKPLE